MTAAHIVGLPSPGIIHVPIDLVHRALEASLTLQDHKLLFPRSAVHHPGCASMVRMYFTRFPGALWYFPLRAY